MYGFDDVLIDNTILDMMQKSNKNITISVEYLINRKKYSNFNNYISKEDGVYYLNNPSNHILPISMIDTSNMLQFNTFENYQSFKIIESIYITELNYYIFLVKSDSLSELRILIYNESRELLKNIKLDGSPSAPSIYNINSGNFLSYYAYNDTLLLGITLGINYAPQQTTYSTISYYTVDLNNINSISNKINMRSYLLDNNNPITSIKTSKNLNNKFMVSISRVNKISATLTYNFITGRFEKSEEYIGDGFYDYINNNALYINRDNNNFIIIAKYNDEESNIFINIPISTGTRDELLPFYFSNNKLYNFKWLYLLDYKYSTFTDLNNYTIKYLYNNHIYEDKIINRIVVNHKLLYELPNDVVDIDSISFYGDSITIRYLKYTTLFGYPVTQLHNIYISENNNIIIYKSIDNYYNYISNDDKFIAMYNGLIYICDSDKIPIIVTEGSTNIYLYIDSENNYLISYNSLSDNNYILIGRYIVNNNEVEFYNYL